MKHTGAKSIRGIGIFNRACCIKILRKKNEGKEKKRAQKRKDAEDRKGLILFQQTLFLREENIGSITFCVGVKFDWINTI